MTYTLSGTANGISVLQTAAEADSQRHIAYEKIDVAAAAASDGSLKRYEANAATLSDLFNGLPSASLNLAGGHAPSQDGFRSSGTIPTCQWSVSYFRVSCGLEDCSNFTAFSAHVLPCMSLSYHHQPRATDLPSKP